MRKALAARSWDAVYPVLRAAGAVLVLYWVAIFTATHLPARLLPRLSSDKFYHLAAFSGLAFLLAAVIPVRKVGAGLHIFCVLAVALGYACFDEWSQQFAAGRSMDVYDLIADAGGTVLGLLTFLLVARTAAFKRFLHPMTAKLRNIPS
ncbi:MAG: VanZ family protein [Pirellulales bacterium]